MLRVEDLGLAIPCLAGRIKEACWGAKQNILMGGIRIVKSGRLRPGYTLPCRAYQRGLLGRKKIY